MKLLGLVLIPTLACAAFGQTKTTSTTVPVTLDHNRIIIDVYFPMADGTKTRVRGWVDSGNPEMCITELLAQKLGLEISDAKDDNGAKTRIAQAPHEFLIGNLSIHPNIKEAKALDSKSVGPGLSAEISIPATVLRNYDVIVDYPNRELTIAAPGTIHFKGTAVKAELNSQNGLLQIPSKIAGENHNLALDVGASFSMLFTDLTSQLSKAHPEWPHMTGAVSVANMWGAEDEPVTTLLRIPEVQYGGIKLAGVAVESMPAAVSDWYAKRAGSSTSGLIGANALLKYRVGLDYAHSTVYFEQTSKFAAPDLDVVGFTLRPESDRSYTVIGVAEFEGKPSVPEVKAGDKLVSIDKVPAAGGTMGQVWSLLGGSPGEVRSLVLDRAGKQFTVQAKVQRFLASPKLSK